MLVAGPGAREILIVRILFQLIDNDNDNVPPGPFVWFYFCSQLQKTT